MGRVVTESTIDGRIEALDKLQRLDHDVIVRLETKLDGLIKDVKALSDGDTTYESRIRKVEDALISFEPTKNLTRLDMMEKRMDRIIWVSVGAGTVISTIITQAPNLLRSWGIIK